MKRAQRNTRRRMVNAFGSLGYIFCCLQWLWAVMLYLSFFQAILPATPPKNEPIEPALPPLVLPDPVELTILAVVTIVMVAVTVYVLVKMPANVARTGSQAVHKTTEAVVPMVIKAQHRKDTKKNRIKLTVELLVIMKILLVIVPMVLTAASGLLEKESVAYSIALIIGGGLASFSVMFFVLQYTLAKLLGVKLLDAR